MKSQQRKFIVEVKSSRRRTTNRASSIWGDTDLKALAREAETEAPHLFQPAAHLDELSTGAIALGPDVEVYPSEGTSPNDVAQAALPALRDEESSGTEDTSGSAATVPIGADRPELVRPEMPRRNRSTRAGRLVESKAVVAAPEASLDDLAALEEENRQLKRLWAQRLQRENIQLRQMLERFGTN